LPEAQGGMVPEWITESGLITYLEGATPSSDQFKATHSLLTPEPRVGLALDVATRSAREGMLYSIAPIRLRDGMSLGVRITGALDPLLTQVPATCRLGGEGRIVEITAHNEIGLPVSPTVEASLRATGRFRLLLLQPADFAGSWLPAGFTATEIDGTTCWQGTLDGVMLRIVVSCGGPPVAIGGWDMVRREAKALRWCVPAGTVYYCEMETGSNVQKVLQQFHDQKLGVNAQMGFGHVVIGAWPVSEGGHAS
jgi:CRISPR-associated protein Cmr3